MKWLAALAALAVAPPAAGESRHWDFRVMLDGAEVGRHTFTREEGHAGAARVLSEARFDVRFLFVTAYRYEHRAEERWQGSCVASLDATTNDNGKRREVRLKPTECVKTFAYWDPQILQADRLLNAQTGELMPVRPINLGRELIMVRGQAVAASRHRLTATGMSIDLWYAEGDWVALESILESGRRLRYERL